MATVTIRDLHKRYPEGFHAVRGISLDVADGEFLVLVGPSGCGKSTTLRMVAGLEEVTSGEIRIGDRVVNDVAPGDRDIAMVFQNYALYPHLSVRENMAFGLKMRGTPRAEIDRRVADAAAALSIEHLLARRPRDLSGGWRWGGPSSASRGCFSSTSRSPTSTPSSGCRCGPNSPGCTAGWARR